MVGRSIYWLERKQLRDSVIEEVKDENGPVVNEKKSSTKVCIVHDASAKAGEYSLNECLYKGECLTPLIFENLLRFQLHDVAIVYLQISVLLIIEIFYISCGLTIRNGNTEIKKYRFTQVLFGLAPSQFLLNAVIRKHVAGYNDLDFTKMVRRVFYVDDLVVRGDKFLLKM